MNFEIDKKKLIDQLNHVVKGISSKNLIPILNCIKLDLTKEGLYLISTNNDLAIKSFIPAKDIKNINVTGTIVVYGKYFYEIIRKLPNNVINIEEVVDSKINVYTKNSSFYLNCNKVEDFPILDINESSNPIILNKVVLKNIINQTIFATSNDEGRPILTGLNIKIDNNILECTATDSYRLSVKTINISDEINKEINIIIPNKNIQELNKILNDGDEEIELHIFNNNIIFKFDNILFMSRLINGTYPNTSQLIPNEFNLKVKLNRSLLFNAIDRASLLTSEFEKNIVNLNLVNNEITITSNIPEIGKVEEKIIVEKDNNENIAISFSSKYMLDALRSLDEDEIQISFSGEIKPLIITNCNDLSLTQLILPIRTY